MPSCPMSSRALVTFIGATTENPSFEVNSALLSRAAVYVLKSLTRPNWASCSTARWRDLRRLEFDAAARERLIGLCRRRRAAPAQRAGAGAHRRWRPHRRASTSRLSGADAGDRPAPLRQGRRCLLRPDLGPAQVGARLDPDAALYWLVRMLDGGADPLYMGRRIVRMAIEDVGLADPRAWASRSTPAPPTSAWAARKASWRWRMRCSTWPWRQVERRLRRL
jgi:putative ATPase